MTICAGRVLSVRFTKCLYASSLGYGHIQDVRFDMEEKDYSGARRTVLIILDVWKIWRSDRLALVGCDGETYGRWATIRQLG